MLGVLVLLAATTGSVAGVHSPVAADGVERVFTSEPGCFESEWYTIGMKGDGEGSFNLEPGPGPIVFASLQWVGTNDTTPDVVVDNGDGRADSTLILNGTPVVGRQPEGLTGVAGHQGATWYTWSARIGPDSLGIIDRNTTRLDVTGWDGGPGEGFQRNGALLSLVYDTSPCKEPIIVEEYEGVDYFYHGYGDPHSDTVFIPVANAEAETSLKLPFGLAGSEVDVTGCRGIGLWYIAGSGEVPEWGSFDLVDNSGATGVGVNGGVEIVNDPFSHPAGDCVAKLNQAPPAVGYAEGHPYPGGAATAPYRALDLRPPRGPNPKADIALSIIDVAIPPGSDWIGFQFESEPEEGGESGAWMASQTILRPMVGVIGDFAWFDANQNCIQDPGEVGVEGVTAELVDSTGAVIQTQATGADGKYLFTELAAADYQVRFTTPPGWELTNIDCGSDDNADSDARPAASRLVGITDAFTLPPAAGDLSRDVGLIQSAPTPPPVAPTPADPPPETLAFTGVSSEVALFSGIMVVLFGLIAGAVAEERTRMRQGLPPR